MNDVLFRIGKELEDNIKLKNIIKDLRKQLEKCDEDINQLKSQNDDLQKENQRLIEENQRKDFEIKHLKSKNQELNESHANLQKSLSLRSINTSVKKPPKPKVPLKKSKSTVEPLNEEIDQFFDIISKPDASSNAILSSNPRKKKASFELFDDYFDESKSLNENESRKTNDTQSNINERPKLTPFFVIKNQKEDNDETNENDSIQTETQNEETTKAKGPKPKKKCVLPLPQPIPDLLKEIESLDIDQIDPIVTRVLAESHSSITALKRRYIDILNSLAVSIKTTKNVDEIHQIISFFVKFALRISPESLELFKKSVASDKKLISAISAIEEMTDIF